MKIDPACCICGNAYGTRHVCDPCKADPANVDWVEAREDEAELPVGVRPAWQATELFREVARRLVEGASLRDAAKAAKCSASYVRKVKTAIGA